MSFDFSKQQIIFKQSKFPQDDIPRTVRFSLFDNGGIEKQNYEIDLKVNWSVKDDPLEVIDEYKENPNLCNSKDESLKGEKDSGYRGC